MSLKFIGISATILIFAGCSTAQKKSTVSNLEMQADSLEKELAQKEKEIQELKGQLEEQHRAQRFHPYDSASPAMVTSPPEANRAQAAIIRVDVPPSNVQHALKNAGFYDGPIDGKIGQKTKGAIMEFQKANGLIGDGVVGKKTWTQLKAHLE